MKKMQPIVFRIVWFLLGNKDTGQWTHFQSCANELVGPELSNPFGIHSNPKPFLSPMRPQIPLETQKDISLTWHLRFILLSFNILNQGRERVTLRDSYPRTLSKMTLWTEAQKFIFASGHTLLKYSRLLLCVVHLTALEGTQYHSSSLLVIQSFSCPLKKSSCLETKWP